MTLAAENLAIGQRLEGVSASLERGAITAICGPNGAGKSTLLSALAGLIAPDTGKVLLSGAPLSAISLRERARRIGYLAQDGDVAWDVAVRNLVALGRLPHGDRGEEAIDAAIAALDLGELQERPVSRLSGGEKARALLARVLAGEPEWILADEPLAALDIGHQLRLIRYLRAAASGGTGVVLVLHDLALAMNHSDRVLVLHEGTLVADGVPEQALCAEIIGNVWGVAARWLGDPGERSLLAHG